MLNTILCILISIAFVYILANPKVPNSLLFYCWPRFSF